jgi:hypothetical protein
MKLPRLLPTFLLLGAAACAQTATWLSDISATVTRNSITVNWVSSVPATTQAKYSKTGGAPWKNSKQDKHMVTNHTVTFSNLASSVVYTLVVMSVDSTPTQVSSPSFQVATAAGYVVQLTWDSSPDKVNGYNVYRGKTSGCCYAQIATGVNGLAYSDTTVQPGNDYFYRVTAVNVDGESDYSNETEAILPTSQPDEIGGFYSQHVLAPPSPLPKVKPQPQGETQ